MTVNDNNSQSAVEKVSPTGEYLATYLLKTNSDMFITNGPDGNLWISESGAGKIARMTRHGGITEFAQLKGIPHQIIKGPDGNLWFADAAGADYVGRITTSGIVTEFQIVNGCSECGIYGLTVGPDKNLWWADESSQEIGYTTTAGKSRVLMPPFNGQPTFLTAGSDKNLWFTSSGRIDIYVRLEMNVVPSVVNFQNIGDTRTVDVSEKKYRGSWTASTSNPSVASVMNDGSPDGFTITAVGTGSAVISISDLKQNSFPVPVTVP